MIIVLTTSRGPIGVEPSSVRAVLPNKADSACTVVFSESHSIEVIGSLAKIRSKLDGDGAAARPAATESEGSSEAAPPASESEDDASSRPSRPTRPPGAPPLRPRPLSR